MVFPNKRLAAKFVDEYVLKILFFALVVLLKLLDEAEMALGVANFPFVEYLLVNGDADVFTANAVFKTSSFWFKRSRSRKSHADVCLTSVGRATADNFFVVDNVARTGLIGVVVVEDVDGVEHFAAVTFAPLTVGVYRVAIFTLISNAHTNAFDSVFVGFN